MASCKIPSVVLVLLEQPGHPCAEKGARVGAIEVPPICLRGVHRIQGLATTHCSPKLYNRSRAPIHRIQESARTRHFSTSTGECMTTCLVANLFPGALRNPGCSRWAPLRAHTHRLAALLRYCTQTPALAQDVC